MIMVVSDIRVLVDQLPLHEINHTFNNLVKAYVVICGHLWSFIFRACQPNKFFSRKKIRASNPLHNLFHLPCRSITGTISISATMLDLDRGCIKF